jgi:hypothetical protein
METGGGRGRHTVVERTEGEVPSASNDDESGVDGVVPDGFDGRPDLASVFPGAGKTGCRLGEEDTYRRDERDRGEREIISV